MRRNYNDGRTKVEISGSEMKTTYYARRKPENRQKRLIANTAATKIYGKYIYDKILDLDKGKQLKTQTSRAPTMMA